MQERDTKTDSLQDRLKRVASTKAAMLAATERTLLLARELGSSDLTVPVDVDTNSGSILGNGQDYVQMNTAFSSSHTVIQSNGYESVQVNINAKRKNGPCEQEVWSRYKRIFCIGKSRLSVFYVLQ